MPQSLLCALDLTENASSIAAYAHELAEALGWQIHGVHVCDVPETPHPGTVTDAIETAAAKLREVLARATGNPEIEGEIRVGPTHLEILAAAERAEAELIVMSTRARGPIRRALLGSTAEAVLKSSPRPVLTLPVGASWQLPRSILVAHDLENRAGLAFAAHLHALDARIHVLHTIGPDLGGEVDSGTASAAHLRARNAAVAQLDEDIRAVFGSPAPSVSAHVVSEEPVFGIRLFLNQVEPDLLVVGRSHRSVLERAFFGATGIKLVRKATVPVLMVPESDG